MRAASWFVLLALLVTAPTFAQDEPAGAETDMLSGEPPPSFSKQSKLQFIWDVGAQYQLEGDLGIGEMDVVRTRTALAMRDRIDRNWRYTAHLSYGFQYYSMSDTRFTEWDSIHAFGLGIGFEWSIAPDWTLLFGGYVRAAAEEGAKWEDAIGGGGHVGATYEFNDGFTLGGVVAMAKPIEENFEAAIFPIVNWTISDNVSFGTTVASGAFNYVGYAVTWDVARKFDVGLGMRYTKQRFRISDSDNVVEEEIYQFYTSVVWQFSPQGTLEFGGGVSWELDLTLEDSGGRRITSDEYENGEAFIEMSMRYRF